MEKWLEVSLDNLKENIQSLQNYFRVPIMAVIKQNGYGLGDLPLAIFMEQMGIGFFAVTNVSEGVRLRKGGITASILVFAPMFSEKSDLQSLVQYKLIPAVYSLEAAEALNDYVFNVGKMIDVHLKVDTGMGRLGFAPDELLNAAEKLKQLKALSFRGIFTHYSNAFEQKMDYTKRQLDIFLKTLNRMEEKGFEFQLKYSANSMAALKFPETHMDMVTIGSAFLGNSVINRAVPLKKVYCGKVRVLQVRSIEKGNYIGYSNTFKTKKNTRVAVLPIGYTDGFGLQKRIDAFRFSDYLREQFHLLKTFLKPVKSVAFERTPLSILGKISLQITVVDIGALPLKAGDVVNVDLNPLLVNARLPRTYISLDQSLRVQSVPENDFAEAAFASENEVACGNTPTE